MNVKLNLTAIDRAEMQHMSWRIVCDAKPAMATVHKFRGDRVKYAY